MSCTSRSDGGLVGSPGMTWSRPSSVCLRNLARGDALASFVVAVNILGVNSPGLPGIRPRNLAAGTVSDAGMVTSSVVIRGSWGIRGSAVFFVFLWWGLPGSGELGRLPASRPSEASANALEASGTNGHIGSFLTVPKVYLLRVRVMGYDIRNVALQELLEGRNLRRLAARLCAREEDIPCAAVYPALALRGQSRPVSGAVPGRTCSTRVERGSAFTSSLRWIGQRTRCADDTAVGDGGTGPERRGARDSSRGFDLSDPLSAGATKTALPLPMRRGCRSSRDLAVEGGVGAPRGPPQSRGLARPARDDGGQRRSVDGRVCTGESGR